MGAGTPIERCSREVILQELDRHRRDHAKEIARFQENLASAEKWIDDLQAKLYINCVYCGHRYGPGEEITTTMRSALFQHIARCPKHPLSVLRLGVKRIAQRALAAEGVSQTRAVSATFRGIARDLEELLGE